MKKTGPALITALGALCSQMAFAQTYSRTDTLAYDDNLSLWVIGQPKMSTNAETGMTETQTDYDPVTAMPIRTYAFGKLQQTMTYDTASLVSTGQRGTLTSVSDGRDTGTYNTTITLSNWKRGIPQTITFPDTGNGPKSKSAVVDDLGRILSVTDETNSKTCYGYDPMGRLNRITYPSESQAGVCADYDPATNPNGWNPTILSFAPAATAKYGLPVGHWQQTATTGNGVKTTYFDALWRPLVAESYDAADAGGTRSVTVTRYDADGRQTYRSYPTRTLTDYATSAQGTRTWYDALGRTTRVEQDSEFGVTNVATTTEYLPGFKTLVKNPNGYTTLTAYRAYDQPTFDMPSGITHPEGAATEIYRDIFGAPTLLRRRNGDGTVDARRYYVYDGNHQLCKTIEPETGTTVTGYDEAGNPSWSASGLSLTSTTDCEYTAAHNSGRVVNRGYDQRNHLTTLLFPGSNGNQTWEYEDDGLPKRITTLNDGGANSAINAYSYNKRRLLAGESLEQPGWYTWSIGYGLDRNANLSNVLHPGGEIVSFAPNALGQPSQATSQYATYASGVSYFPNGAMQQFTYGNGLVHTLIQNTRQLPDQSKDAYNGIAVLDDSYDYDLNGNVAAISDGLVGARGNRTMSYDGLDRLKSTNSPMFGGTITYTYDVLDNLQTLTAPSTPQSTARNLRYCYDSATGYDPAKTGRLMFVRSGATTCSDGSATTALEYDLQGNLRTKNGQTYSFDYGNRLRSAAGQEAYRYDGYGRRILGWSAQGLGNILSMYGHDGVLRYQNDARKNKVYNYVYLNGSLVGTRETDISTMAQTIKYQHTDALGTPIAVTDVNRAVIERNEYEPYGKRLTGPGQNRPGYTGHVEDAATGLTYMQQRYYDPAIGRFLSVDPVTANSATGANFNRYWYANNNPYRFTDPDGRLGELFWTSPTTVTLTIPYVLTGEALPFTTTELNAQFASHFSGTVEVNGRTVTVSAQAVQVPASTTARPANTVNVVHDTNGVTPSGRSQTNAIGGNVVTLGATGPEAASSQTGSHEFGHAAGAGDQYRGGLGANGQTLTQNVPGPANIMRELGPAGANQQTLREILTAPTNSNACAQGVSGAANGACQ